MNICLYKNGVAAGSINLPESVFAACRTLDRWLSEQDGDCSVYGLGRVSHRDERIATLLTSVAYEQRHAAESEIALATEHAALLKAEARIAELEKQAAIDKTLLALADARINRDLRDDFAGRAMQGILAQPGMTVDIDGDYIGQARAGLAYGMAEALLKAKGGA